MSSRYLLLVRMDIAHDHEATVDEIYEKDHIPALTAVPGVGTATRYSTSVDQPMMYVALRTAPGAGAEGTGAVGIG